MIYAVLFLGLGQTPARAEVPNDVIETVTDSVGNITDVLFPGITNIRLGAGPITSPDYEGSDDYRVKPLPLISFRYRNLLEVDNNHLRVNLFGLGSKDKDKPFRAGPQVRVDFGREENDNPALAGLGDIGTGVELGLYASYTIGPTRTRIRFLHDVAGGHSGTKIIGDVRLLMLKTDKLAVTGSVSTAWANHTYMNQFFTIDPAQSLASGLPVFNAGAGIKDVRIGFTADYELSERWDLLGHVSYKRLLGDAADSPIVSSRGSANQAAAGIFAILSF